jgi:DDE superfamily endonuclease
MIWGAIWIGGRSDIIIMERDDDSSKGGFSANSYIKVLEEAIPTAYEPGMIFMQDNAPIHKANIVEEWLESYGIEVLEWPPYSPDLNPIEHVWKWLKEWIFENKPNLLSMGKCQAAYNALGTAIKEAWEALDQEKIDTLIKSMDNRINAVLAAKGWQTRY